MPLDPRIEQLYRNPAFWLGCAKAREDAGEDSTARNYRRLAAALDDGADLWESTTFQLWLKQTVIILPRAGG